MNDLYHGAGRMQYLDGRLYEGDFIAGVPQGSGRLVSSCRTREYVGQFYMGLEKGHGTQKVFGPPKGDQKEQSLFTAEEERDLVETYTGQFHAGFREGEGELV